jgi:hypothetical protein
LIEIDMLRDDKFDATYFSKSIAFKQAEAIDNRKMTIMDMPRHEGRASRASDLCTTSTQLSIMRYSRGDAIAEMRDTTVQMAQMLKLRQEVLASVTLEPSVRAMRERLDLGTLYENITCLTFMMALRFSLPERLQVLGWIGHAGEDALLDRVALLMGDTDRQIAVKSKYPPVYGDLVSIFTAEASARKALLHKYVGGWYKRMKPIYWHNAHKGAEGAYFGYWCFEAALVAMLLDIDDSSLRGHPNYPGDLVEHYRRIS